MKIFKTSDIAQIDRFTIENEPILSINLMKRAAHEFYLKMLTYIPSETNIFKIFAGNGNNGGDAFFVALELIRNGKNAHVYCCQHQRELSADCKEAKRIFQDVYPRSLTEITKIEDLPGLSSSDYVIDGLFGSGLNRPLTGFYAEVVKYINSFDTTVFAIDIPSGLLGEDNSENIKENIICADYTLTFQFPKLAFLFPENEAFVGEWQVLDIGLHPAAIEATSTDFYLTEKDDVKVQVIKRKKFSHKGTYGHALIIGGSKGKIGAAVLASRACMRSGVGLLTTHIPACGYDIMQISVPEAMVTVDENIKYFTGTLDITPYNAVGIGVGLQKEPKTISAFRKLLKQLEIPVVFDADALNILSENKDKDMLKLIPPGSIFTPHPKELERLIGYSANSFDRIKKTISFASEYNVYVIIKGAYSVIVAPDGSCRFNSTGNPGMATAGSGDVLCGIITGLLAQQYAPLEAAVLGTYFHGRAGDQAALKHSQAGMIAGDIIEELRIE